MFQEVDDVARQVLPLVEAAVHAYGPAVLTRAEDASAAATVRLGQRVLGRLLHRSSDRGAVEAAVDRIAAVPGDADSGAYLLAQFAELLRHDERLLSEVAALRSEPRASGRGSVAIGGTNTGIVSTGDGATNNLGTR